MRVFWYIAHGRIGAVRALSATSMMKGRMREKCLRADAHVHGDSMETLPILFAPGMMCDQRLFQHQITALEKKHPIYVADFTNDVTISCMADRLVRQGPPRFLLVGLSMGGIIALDVMQRYAERVAGLVLMDTTPYADTTARMTARRKQINRVRQGALRHVVLEELKPNYLAEKANKNQAIRDILWNMAYDLGSDVFIRQSNALMGRRNNFDVLQKISCPTLIVCGTEDKLCPLHLHQEMKAGIRGATLYSLQECGHIPPLEHPVMVTKQLAAHIERVSQ